MKLQQYLDTVAEQIRCQKIRPSVTEELKEHILDQAEAYVASGAMEDEALERAVREMGDPVETGAALDRIHRPKMSWEIIGLIALLSTLGVGALYLLSIFTDAPVLWRQQASYTLAGFAAMLLVCHIDYSILGAYGKRIAAGFLILIYVLFFTSKLQVGGTYRYIYAFGFFISLPELMFLYLPLYGAVLYSYRGKGFSVLPRLLLWTLPPLALLFAMPAFPSFCMFFAALFFMTAFAISKDWYRLPKRKTLAALTGCVLLVPALFIFYVYAAGAEYQTMRLKMFFSGEQNYLQTLAGQMMTRSALFGKSNAAVGLMNAQPMEYQTDYILAAMCSVYGTILVIGVILLLLWIIFRIFHISMRQKSQLGMMTGFSCGLVFLIKTALGVLNNLQLIPHAAISIPFLSYGGSGILVSYLLLGFALSVYRYKDILPGSDMKNSKVSAL